MFLAAAIIAVITAVVLIANVSIASGQGVDIGRDVMETLTATITQIMVAFWILLIGYLVFRYLSNRKKISGTKMEVKAGHGQSLLPYAILLLALWLFVFLLRPFDPGGILNGQPGTDAGEDNITTPLPEASPQNMSMVLPLVVVLFALASIIVIWRFLRRNDTLAVAGPESRRENAMAVLDQAVISLYAGEDPRSTVIRTYQRMCLLVQAGKIEDEAFLTPKEFAVRAAKELGWKAGPLEELTALFEEARYSRHEMGEPEKARAINSFESLRESLEARQTG